MSLLLGFSLRYHSAFSSSKETIICVIYQWSPCCLQSVEGMKVVCHELAQATADPDGSTMDDIVKDADRLVSCLATKAIILLFSVFCFAS